MKKILFFASALAGLFFAASCQQENLEPVAGGNTVTYTVQIPDVIGTKVGEDVTAVNELVYEVYRTEATSADDYSLTGERLFQKTTSMENGRAIINFELVNSQNFRVLFWAHVKDNGVYTTSDLTNVSLTQILAGNTENYAAFAGTDYIKDGDALTGRTITLVRPVAQLNIGTSEESLDIEGQTTVKVNTTAVTVNGLSTTFNVSNLQAGAISAADFVYSAAAAPNTWGSLTVNGEPYRYLSMNYLGFAPQSGTTVEVEYTINTDNVGTINNTINNVPVKANYRTNIVGNLITSKTSYIVDLKEEFYDPNGGNMFVENDGVVKNVNGAYEISNANGLAYAINNLFEQGGDFYLTAAEYDMTGFVLNPVTVEAGKTLNLYGETPVVTRATTLSGVTITGLTGALIETVHGSLSVSDVNLPDAGSVLVGNNSGNVIVYETTVGDNGKLVGDGNAPIAASEITTLDQLKSALNAGAQEVKLTADLNEVAEIIAINNSVIINGNGKTLYTSANRAIRIEKGGINVVINNLKIVSSSAPDSRYYLYGISVNSDLSNSALTLNDCDIQFTYNTTLDNTYAVNIVGGTGHKITVNGGSYVGANVINVWGNNHMISVDGAVLTSLYAYNPNYVGCCVRIEDSNNKVTVKNSTFNGEHAAVISEAGDAENNEYIFENNTDNTRRYVYESGSKPFHTLAEAIESIESEGEIKVLSDTEIPYTVIPAGKNITLNLNEKTVSNITTGSSNPQDAILVKGTLNVKNGTITTKHEGENLGWNAQSTVFNITAGGVVNLNAVTAKNLGGTDMGFVAHLNNWGEATLNVESSMLEANYVAVRVFNSGNDKNNVTIKNSTIKGGSYAFWVHNYTIADFGSAEKAITQYGLLNFNLTDGNTYVGKNNTPIRLGMSNAIYLAADQIGNLPTYASVDSEDTLIAALKAATANTIIYFANDITVSNKWDNRYTGAKTSKPIEINGNGKILKFTGDVVDMNYSSVFRFEDVATVKNLTIDLSEATNSNQLRAISSKSTLLVDNCKFIGKSDINSRGIIFGEGAGQNLDFSVSITNSEFTNWKRGITDNENAQDIKNVEIVANSFESAHVYVSAYENISFNDNIMDNSCVNMRSYTSPKTVRITAKGNTLDSNLSQYNIIGTPSVKCNIANIDAQEGFTVYAE